MTVLLQLLLVAVLLLHPDAAAGQFTAAPPTCPDAAFIFSCTVGGDNTSFTTWRVGGNSNCFLLHISPIVTAACGPGNVFTATSGTGFGTAATSFSSTLSVTATTALNGTLVECLGPGIGGDLGDRVGSSMILVLGVPTAPNITTVSESNRTGNNITITVTLQEPVYGSECIQNCTVIVRADGEEDMRIGCSPPDDEFIQVTVCPRQFTFTTVACSSVGCSNESAPEMHTVTDGLLRVTNLMNNSGILEWNQPQNAPLNCITNYTIDVGGVLFNTSDNGTSIPIDSITGLLASCQLYTSITVIPNVPPLGAIESSRSEPLNDIMIFITPEGGCSTPTATSSLPSPSPPTSPPPVPPTAGPPTAGPPLIPVVVGVIVAVLVLLLLIVINIVLFWIWWTRGSDISKCAEIAIIIVHFVTVVGISFGITILCYKYCECCKCWKETETGGTEDTDGGHELKDVDTKKEGGGGGKHGGKHGGGGGGLNQEEAYSALQHFIAPISLDPNVPDKTYSTLDGGGGEGGGQEEYNRIQRDEPPRARPNPSDPNYSRLNQGTQSASRPPAEADDQQYDVVTNKPRYTPSQKEKEEGKGERKRQK